MKYIGLDIGTSGCKAAIMDEKGNIYQYAHEKYSFTFPETGYVELSPIEIYEKSQKVLMCLGPNSEDVVAMSISTFGEAFALLNGEGQPLYPFMSYADCRGKEELDEAVEKIDMHRLFEITGAYPNQSFSLLKLLWLQKHRPELVSQAEHFCLVQDYLHYMYTGNFGVDRSLASKSLMYDLKKKTWSQEILETFHIPKEWMPPVYTSGTSMGYIKPDLAEKLHLPSTMQVFVGCHDQCSTALGGGGVVAGDLIVGEGSTECMNWIVSDEILEQAEQVYEKRMCLEPFAVDGLYLLPCAMLTCGNAVNWFVHTFQDAYLANSSQSDVFGALEAQMTKRTSLIFTPHLTNVNIMNPETQIDGGFVGVVLETKLGEFYTSVLQGINFESKWNRNLYEEFHLPIHKMICTGGLTKSSIFLQMKADVFQEIIAHVSNTETSILGQGVICAVATGTYSTYVDAIKAMAPAVRDYEPQDDYEALYNRYKAVRNALGCINEI